MSDACTTLPQLTETPVSGLKGPFFNDISDSLELIIGMFHKECLDSLIFYIIMPTFVDYWPMCKNQ